MKLRLDSREVVPPPATWELKDGSKRTVQQFSYLVPETQIILQGPTYNALLGAVLKHLRANDLPQPPDLEEWIEDAFCRASPAQCHPAGMVRAERASDFSTVELLKRFFRCLLAAVKRHKTPIVDQQEADRRSEICANCTKNTTIKGCWGCGRLLSFVVSVIGQRKSRFHERLKGCGVCGCENSTSVWVHIDIHNQCSGELEYPKQVNPSDPQSPPCWKLPKEKKADS